MGKHGRIRAEKVADCDPNCDSVNIFIAENIIPDLLLEETQDQSHTYLNSEISEKNIKKDSFGDQGPAVASLGSSMSPNDAVEDCPVVNITQQTLDTIVFCQSPSWKEWLHNDTIPVGTPFAEKDFGAMYVLCENIYQPQTELYNKIMKLFLMAALVFLMTGLGVTMEPKKIIMHAKRPVGAIVATVVQFLIMPFVCWGLAIAFQMSEMNMLSMVILGCCPGGTLSNFMALLLRGDMNLSILMTSVSTVVGIGAIPAMISMISGQFLDPCTTLTVNTMKIIISLAFTLGPCGIGMIIKAKCSEKVQTVVLKLGQIMMLFGMIMITVCNCLIFKTSVFKYFPMDVMAACALVPAAGFIIGFGCSYAVCEKPRARRTIMLETGLKNAQICLAILTVSFPITDVGVLMMMPLYFLFFQCLESAFLAVLFTKILGTQEEEKQEAMLEYDEGVDKSKFQRQYSKKIAKRTKTQEGKTSRGATFSKEEDIQYLVQDDNSYGP